MSLVTNNAIGWANLQISGGWRRVAWICALVAVGLPLIMFGSMQLGEVSDPKAAARTLAGWYTMLGVVQGGLLLIGVPSRVHAAIKRDRTAKVIESHRLMPAPAGHAIAGYIVGPNLLLLSCIGTVFLIGAFIAVPAGEDWRGWVALHAAATGIAGLLACLIAFTSQWLPRFNPAILTIFIGPALGTLSAAAILPSVKVLFSPYFGDGFMALKRGEVLPMHLIGFGCQTLVAAILFIGACRRYRRDDVPALGFGWGFVLLTTWVAMGLIGTLAFPERSPFGQYWSDVQSRLSFILHASLTMLLAIGPIASAAGASLTWGERRKIDPHFIDRRPVSLPAAAACVAAVLCVMTLAAPVNLGAMVVGEDFTSRSAGALAWGLTCAQFLVFAGTIALLARGSVRLKLASTAWLIVPWILLSWGVPPVMDASSSYVAGRLDSFPHALAAPSPPIGLVCIWTGRTTEAAVGLITQAALAVILMTFWLIVKRFNGRRGETIAAAHEPPPTS